MPHCWRRPSREKQRRKQRTRRFRRIPPLSSKKNRKTRKRYFPKGRFAFEEFTGSSVPLEYSCGDDGFTANFVFQRMERSGTRIFLEIIEWQLVNDAVSARCLQAMRGLEPMLRDAVLDIDTNARFRMYDR